MQITLIVCIIFTALCVLYAEYHISNAGDDFALNTTMSKNETFQPLNDFVEFLREADLSANTRKGYRFDLEKFISWYFESFGHDLKLAKLSAIDLINYRQYLLKIKGYKPTTINRRLEALRKFCRWAYQNDRMKKNVAESLKPLKFARNKQPAGLKELEVHALLRLCGNSAHGLAARNYAIVQLLVHTGLRVSEVSALTLRDVVARERSGTVRVRHGKGLKEREVPLNSSVRRAIRAYLDERVETDDSSHLFLSERGDALSTRSIQVIVSQLGKKAKIERVSVSAHTLRHTFALNYLKQNPGKIVDLANLLGHESLDTTAIYTRPSREDLARDLENSNLNIYG